MGTASFSSLPHRFTARQASLSLVGPLPTFVFAYPIYYIKVIFALQAFFLFHHTFHPLFLVFGMIVLFLYALPKVFAFWQEV